MLSMRFRALFLRLISNRAERPRAIYQHPSLRFLNRREKAIASRCFVFSDAVEAPRVCAPTRGLSPTSSAACRRVMREGERDGEREGGRGEGGREGEGEGEFHCLIHNANAFPCLACKFGVSILNENGGDGIGYAGELILP